MTVATTRLPVSCPAAWRRRAAIRRTASPSTMRPERRDEDGAVGIAIEGYAAVGTGFENGGAEVFDVQGAAIEIDVAAVGPVGDGVDTPAPSRRKRSGASVEGSAVAAIENDFETGERSGEGGGEEIEIVRPRGRGRARGGAAPREPGRRKAEDFSLRRGLLLHRGVCSRSGEDLDAVVLEGIVGGGDHDAGGEGVVAGEPGHAGVVTTPAETARTRLSEPGGDLGGDRGTGFASVHAD